MIEHTSCRKYSVAISTDALEVEMHEMKMTLLLVMLLLPHDMHSRYNAVMVPRQDGMPELNYQIKGFPPKISMTIACRACKVMRTNPKPSHGCLYPPEIVTYQLINAGKDGLQIL